MILLLGTMRRIAVALATLVCCAVALFALDPRGADEEKSSTLKIEREGMLYMFHLPTGTESLYDLGADPGCLSNLLRERPEDASALRRALLERLGVQSLDELRDPDDRLMETLRGLGYL